MNNFYAITITILITATIAAEKKDFNAMVDITCQQRHRSMKCMSRAPGISACLKSMLRTIIMQELTLTAIVGAEKQKLEQVPGGARIPPAGAINVQN